uniref:Uncharacterized protein n=1 Tax=Avena sativa TaxID=4498 RepID=A0ACD5Y906_AVESA
MTPRARAHGSFSRTGGERIPEASGARTEASPRFSIPSTCPLHSLPIELIYLPPSHALLATIVSTYRIGGIGSVAVCSISERGSQEAFSDREFLMVVLMEYAPGVGVSQKRKGAEDPGLFACPGDGVPISCRATKMRRLAFAGTGHDVPVTASVGTETDVVMTEEPPEPSPGAAEGERAVVVYDPAGDAARAGGWIGQYRLPPWASLSAGAEWIRDMLREADSRTVRAVLSGAQEEGGADLAMVPWVAWPAPRVAEQASTAAETVDGEPEDEDAEGTAAMDVEVEGGHHQTSTLPAGCGEGYLWWWPQHCLAPPPQLPAAGQASPVVGSW